jgi:hypothetical protein
MLFNPNMKHLTSVIKPRVTLVLTKHINRSDPNMLSPKMGRP